MGTSLGYKAASGTEPTNACWVGRVEDLLERKREKKDGAVGEASSQQIPAWGEEEMGKGARLRLGCGRHAPQQAGFQKAVGAGKVISRVAGQSWAANCRITGWARDAHPHINAERRSI